MATLVSLAVLPLSALLLVRYISFPSSCSFVVIGNIDFWWDLPPLVTEIKTPSIILFSSQPICAHRRFLMFTYRTDTSNHGNLSYDIDRKSTGINKWLYSAPWKCKRKDEREGNPSGMKMRRPRRCHIYCQVSPDNDHGIWFERC